MTRYPSTSFAPSRFQVEAKESTSAERLAVLSQRRSAFVQSEVAKNPHTSPETLAALGDSENKWTRSAVAANPNTPVAVLLRLAGDSESMVRSRLGYNSHTPPEALSALATDLVAAVRAAAAWNRRTPTASLALLVHDPDVSVRTRLAGNTSTPEATLVLLASDVAQMVRHKLTQRGYSPDAPTEQVSVRRWNGRRVEQREVTRHVETGGRYSEEMIRAFAQSPDVKMRFRAASQPDAPEDVLIALATTDDVLYTLQIITENKAASATVLRAVADRCDTPSLKGVAVHPNTDPGTLAALAVSSYRSVHSALAHARPGGLEWMARHPDPKIRLVAAKQFNNYTGTASGTVAQEIGDLLVGDEDSDVQVAAAGGFPTAALARLVSHENPKVRKVVAERCAAPEHLATLARDPKAIVRRAVAKNEHVPVDALSALAGDDDARTRVNASERFLAALS